MRQGCGPVDAVKMSTASMSRSYSLSKFPNIPTTQDSHQEMVDCYAAAWTLQRTVAEGSPAPIGPNQRFPRVTSDGKPCRQGDVLLPHHYCGNIPLASRLLNSPASQRHDETLTLETFWQLRSVLPCYPPASLKWVLTLTALLRMCQPMISPSVVPILNVNMDLALNEFVAPLELHFLA